MSMNLPLSCQTELLLIRHCETDAVGKILAGRSGHWPLNVNGQAQANRLARLLKGVRLSAVFSSPSIRAQSTAAVVADAQGLPVQCCEYFDEIQFGEWEGCTFDELDKSDDWHRYTRSRTAHNPPGGEPIEEVRVRMLAGLTALANHYPESMVALVGHGDPLRTVIAHCLGLPLD